MSNKSDKPVLVSRWYFGGLASTGAAVCTHPLDLIKVHFQTASSSGGDKGRVTMLSTTVNIVRNDGFLALYNGLSASVLRQMTYSTTRFGIYEIGKQRLAPDGHKISLLQSIGLAGISGAAGGLIGDFH